MLKESWVFIGRTDAEAATLATSCKELTHWKRPWCWEGSGAGGEGDDRGWDGWMASPTRWTWVWLISRNWWWTGRPGVLQFMGSQRVGHDWGTELNWAYFPGSVISLTTKKVVKVTHLSPPDSNHPPGLGALGSLLDRCCPGCLTTCQYG